MLPVVLSTTAGAVDDISFLVLGGLFTATYGLFQRLGIDAIHWTNPFNPIIASLGPPSSNSPGLWGSALSPDPTPPSSS